MLILFLLLWLLLPVISFAESTMVINCVVHDQEVEYFELPHSTFEDQGQIEAMSGINEYGERLIAYDENLLQLPDPYINAVLSHECAHHQLGHLSSVLTEHIKSIQNDSDKMLAMHITLEDAADCNGSRMLTNKLGYGAAEFNVIAENIMEHEFLRFGDPDISYDRATARISNIEKCANL